MNKKLLLFDLDGVLLDSKSNMDSSWLAVCKKYGLDVSFESYFSHIGRPFKDILDILGILEQQQNIEKTFNDVSIELMHRVEFYDGVSSVLNWLQNKQVKTGIVTSKNANKTSKILSLLSFPFDIVQTPNDHLKGKPAPDHILYAITKLDISPSQVLYVGDMEVDCEAAKRAGVDYAHASWGYGECHDQSVLKLKKISELMDILE